MTAAFASGVRCCSAIVEAILCPSRPHAAQSMAAGNSKNVAILFGRADFMTAVYLRAGQRQG